MGCATQSGDPIEPDPDPDPVTPSAFRTCNTRPFAPDPIADWRHDIVSPLVIKAGAANHTGRDAIVAATPGTILRGKFTYGIVSKDLEDEDVRVFLDDCSQWTKLGDFTTDSDGQIAVALTQSLANGVYGVRFQVLGDRTTTTANLWVLPRGTHVTITDIDGTLTESDSELFQQILDGSHVPVAYPGAIDLAAAHRGRGDVLLYLTGRPDWLGKKTRDWLASLGFADGPVRLADSTMQAVPTEGGVGDFKRSVVGSLVAAGYIVDVAYGNASTDIYAYLGAGLAADDVFIIGSHSGEQGTQNAGPDWVSRAAAVLAMPHTVQPFSSKP